MTDDLKRLQAALRAATPPINDDAKQRAIALAQKALAQKNLQSAQGSPTPARPTSERSGFLTSIGRGVQNMFFTHLRPALNATTCLVVAGAAFIIVNSQSPYQPAIQKTADYEQLAQDVPASSENLASQMPAEPSSVPTTIRKKLARSDADTLQSPAGGLAVNEYDTSSMLIEPSVSDLYLKDSDTHTQPHTSGDRFANEAPNPLKIAANEPVSTFSIDVDTASYAYARSAILNGQRPPAEAIRIEEMVNYFGYDYPAPTGDQPFSTSVSTMQTPWNADTKLVRIGLQGQFPALDERPALDLVFLIDTSGSMQDSNKLPLLKQSFRLLLTKLHPEDRVAIVTYAGSAGQVLAPTVASDTATILNSLNLLEAGGSTAGQAGLQQAYQLAESMSGDGRIGRVLLATDGDFNVGISDPEALKTYIAVKRDTGVYLSVLGFGRGNYNDALMQSLAQNGNGTASYIDTLAEAQKTLVDQVSGALFPIANDVKIQVEFNPALVAEYRLIGYETRFLAREDFNNDKVDAGEIGAGHQVTALYEITPVGSPAVRNDPLRYGSQTADVQETGADASVPEYGFLRLRYKIPGDTVSKLIETSIPAGDQAVRSEANFAAAIAGFGQLLSSPKYLGDWGWEEAIALAQSAKGKDRFGYRAEAIQLMQLARTLP